ncbi:MAG TPA: DNA mismatch repair endonuclease MutL [Candidatus Pseudogracilibacillus intestinigallinarum]|uniref:DNA mismatch repair protein MutL n=1 Tax=Candidatus Pseudogracilibacillus intestinigallinarum TaxID=2838742 RepID=A0A9D1PNM8_9BACI|nr:DNA mismatch repair endonuclease MutL [Candidatus Pseudogracilibacillus intestinigallinarum]
MNIRQLPQNLANKIAAGEVVERPASVVKELVENSIDANSTDIRVTLKEAGLLEIKVTDNGDGISEADSKRAFMRHATSKIAYDQDLFHIRSLGFRGEALASIASVSKLTIETSTGDKAGTKLYMEGGEFKEEGKSTARKGTEITVCELFYNTPARLKYMKTIHTELGHITDLMNRYALAHPHIRFTLVHNDKTIFNSKGNGNLLQVISEIYGMQVARNMYKVEAESLDFHVSGFISKPEVTRSNRNFMTTIVNGRYIKSQALNFAITRAYDTLLPIHRYPVVVLHIELDPILVDVNVHPTKLEVRFSKEKELVQLIETLIRDTFKSKTLIPQIDQLPKREKLKTEQASIPLVMPSQNDENEIAVTLQQLDEEQGNRSFDVNIHQVEETIPPLIDDEGTENYLDDDIMQEQTENVRNEERIPMMYPIGQLQGTYILAQNENGLYMIDQHAAQERIKYEFFKKKLGNPINEWQQLLMPLTFEFTTNEILFLDKHKQLFEDVGLYLEPFGGQTYAVRSYPNWFPAGEEEAIIRDMVEQVIKDGTINVEKIREELAILMSCKRSIKANHYLNTDEMTRLLEDLRMMEDPFTCPHGRPVIIHYTYYEIEKMFKRIM